jgi:2-polyprenyl-3-methyl-5-hydroxy-6-metoxy-1,4-benzoquinol methylase
VKLEVNQTLETIGSRAASLEEVRDFYERMPYPRPLTSLDEHRELYRNPERRRALFHLVWPTERPRPGQEILVAGCGTSQAAKYALREPDARVVAIDISETSLIHTRNLQQQYGLNNLTLHRLSILDVGTLGETFDHIVCTGVLHHLPDPDAGLQSLRAVLKPNGAMQIMVYARYGRTGISMMREYSQLLSIRPSYEELTAFAAVLNGLPPDHPLTPLLRVGEDFRHPEALADAFLHPLDRSYTVPEMYAWLDRCGMSFGRWFEQAPYLPQCGALARTTHARRLSELPEREQHSAVELFRGTITRHNFVAYRNARPQPRQPICFTGNEWYHYVPIRLPWTVCLRDHVPPGSVAVLLNRAHQHSDLVLAIQEAQYRLFSNIDGKRTLSEIARNSGNDEIATVEFFQQLWQYDQIVFDASRSLA